MTGAPDMPFAFHDIADGGSGLREPSKRHSQWHCSAVRQSPEDATYPAPTSYGAEEAGLQLYSCDRGRPTNGRSKRATGIYLVRSCRFAYAVSGPTATLYTVCRSHRQPSVLAPATSACRRRPGYYTLLLTPYVTIEPPKHGPPQRPCGRSSTMWIM